MVTEADVLRAEVVEEGSDISPLSRVWRLPSSHDL